MKREPVVIGLTDLLQCITFTSLPLIGAAGMILIPVDNPMLAAFVGIGISIAIAALGWAVNRWFLKW